MEEILVLVLQLFFEVVLQLLVYGGFDIAILATEGTEKPGRVGCLMMLVFGLIGAGIAGLANLVHPGAFLPEPWMRVANLIVGPPLAGGVSWLFADWRRRRFEAKLVPSLHFWFAFWFVLGFDLVRFIYAQH